MDENTTVDNTATLNNAIVENSAAAISLVSNSTTAVIMSLGKLFPDISKNEVFAGENFRKWQERIFGVLDVHEVAWVHTDPKTNDNTIAWTYGNKLQGSEGDMEQYDDKVYCRRCGKQKFIIGKFYQWEMVDNKDIKTHINEYHRLLEDMKAENINLPEGFVAGILNKKLPNS